MFRSNSNRFALTSVVCLYATAVYLAPYQVALAQEPPASVAGELVLFSDLSKGVEIKYPKNWSVQKPDDGLHVARFKAPYPGISISVAKQDLQNPMSLKKFTDSINELAIADGAKHNWAVKVLESKPAPAISNQPAYLSVLSYTVPPPVGQSTVTEATTLKGKTGYTVVFTSIAAFHYAYRPVFDEMVKSMRIK